MKVSVIVPVYNVRQYIKEALDSLINQSYRDLEIILVDDGSTDGSGDICDEYQKKDDRILVIHQENGGLSAARNAGLDIMSGDVISFLDPDDAFSSTMIEEMISALQKNNVDIIECKYARYNQIELLDEETLVHKISNTKTKIGKYTNKGAIKCILNDGLAFCVWNKIYKKNIWENVRFPEGQNFEDLYVIIQLLSNAKALFVLDKKLIMYRTRSGSITDTLSYKNIYDNVNSWSHYVEAVRQLSPEICTAEDVDKALCQEYFSLFNIFARCTFQKPYCHQNVIFLSNEIRKINRLINVSHCSFKRRILHKLWCISPRLVTILYYIKLNLRNNT